MDTQTMVRMLILISTLIFSISSPKSIFRLIWAKKIKIIMFIILFSANRLHYFSLGVLWTLCCIYVLWACNTIENKSKLFFLPENRQSILRIMILIPILVFWISNPKSIFEEIWSEKIKAICFAWKLARAHTQRDTERVSWGCWFLFWD